MKNPVYYFGAYNQPGHTLYARRMGYVKRGDSKFPYSQVFDGNLDGVLVSSYENPYKIVITNFEGIRYTAYSFVDYTSDNRRGSNANFFIPYDNIKYEDDLPAEFEYQVKTEFPELLAIYKRKDIEVCFKVDDSFKFKLD